MKEFLEKSLRQQVTIMEDKELYKKFPLVYRGRYDIFKVETNGVVWMAIYPKDNVGLIRCNFCYRIYGKCVSYHTWRVRV